jgi:hypothetical protein
MGSPTDISQMNNCGKNSDYIRRRRIASVHNESEETIMGAKIISTINIPWRVLKHQSEFKSRNSHI